MYRVLGQGTIVYTEFSDKVRLCNLEFSDKVRLNGITYKMERRRLTTLDSDSSVYFVITGYPVPGTICTIFLD